MTCTFGPPLRSDREDLPPCRLCFVGAPPLEVERCRVTIATGALEDRLLRRLVHEGEPAGAETLISFAMPDGGQRPA